MAEEMVTPETQPEDTLPENQIAVEDSGVLKKKVTVTVARERINAKLDEMFGELRSSAQVPGFRVGHAPRRLIEKRFGKEVSQDVRNALVGESIGKAIEKSALKSIGEPDLDLEAITLPDEGAMSFSFVVEVMPEFDLPELKGVKINRPAIEITTQRVDEQLAQWQMMRATYDATDSAANDGDLVVADVKVTVEGQESHHPAQSLRVAPGQVEGIALVDLGKELTGKKASDSASLTVTVGQAHPNEAWRGKEAKVEIAITQVKARKLPEMNEEFATSMGFDSVEQLRDAVKSRMQAGIQAEAQQGMRQQAEDFLVTNCNLELPEGVVARHTVNLLSRRYVDLMQRGVPRERIDEHMAELQTAAAEQAKRDMKLRFVLAKIIEQQNIDTDESEINSRIAQMARAYDRRPERLRQELESDGRLEEVAVSLREEKALDFVLSQAEITEVTPEQAKAQQEADKKE